MRTAKAQLCVYVVWVSKPLDGSGKAAVDTFHSSMTKTYTCSP